MHDTRELPFEGFKHYIQDPLEASDPLSFDRIKSIFIEVPGTPADPFRLLIQRLTGKTYHGREARDHWQRILCHKEDMQAKLGRRVGILVTALDYFDAIGSARTSQTHAAVLDGLNPLSSAINREEWINRIYAPGYHLEKLKEEMLRAKRYNHALSSILLDVDEFHRINQDYSFKVGPSSVARMRAA